MKKRDLDMKKSNNILSRIIAYINADFGFQGRHTVSEHKDSHI